MCARADVAPTEIVRSIRVTFPCRSFTDTVSFPFGKRVDRLRQLQFPVPCPVALELARPGPFPAAAPSIAKSAVTRSLRSSRPL